MATVIASQALISGAFSLTAQAVQLDYLPRVKIRHTSRSHQGQIYVPLVNWLLMVGVRRARARLPHVEQPRRRVRHRRHDDDGDHHAALLPSSLTDRWEWSAGEGVPGRRAAVDVDLALPGAPTSRRSPTAAGSR